MMKKSLVLTLVLSALLLVTVMAVSVSADASLTIGNVTFVKDTANNLVTFTVPYTAEDVDQITVIAVKGPASAAPAPTESNIVYFNQQSSASSSFTFSVALSEFDSTNPYCWIKVGGTAIATASADAGQEIWLPDVPVAVVYGDIDGNGIVEMTDYVILAQYISTVSLGREFDATDLPGGVFPEEAADVDNNGIIEMTDYTYVAQYVSTLSMGRELDSTLFPGGKFPADNN